MPEYEDIRSSLKTGDVVLMGGSSIFSRAIRRLTRSKWSHVGMVMKVEEFDTLLLWESTTNGHDKDVQTGEVKRGVQLVPEITKLNKFRHSVKEKPYDFDGLELLRSAIESRLFWSNREDLSAYFCSELIAETYQTLGFLSEALPSNEYTPNDFSSSAAVPLDFQGGMSLDDEIIVQEEA
jgi:hypothetical protein